VHTTVTTIGPDGATSSSRPIAVPALAVDLAIEEGGTVALALLGSDVPGSGIAVRVIDPFSEAFACASVEVVDLGAAAEGAHGSAIEATPDGLVVAQRGPLGIDGVLLEPLVRPHAGWDLFHRATPDGVACVSCHPDGHEDGRTWRFLEEGVRRTQVAAHASAPFHWGGELATIDDLLAEVHVRRMGSRSHPTSDDASALQNFLASVPQRRAPASSNPGLAEVGRGVFLRSGCADCHTEPHARSEDVGTGGRFQVPSLTGLAYRMPLMHDGCAATLRDRFEPACGGTNHGDVDLDEAEIESLVEYLSTL
jgi:hypothetical protein